MILLEYLWYDLFMLEKYLQEIGLNEKEAAVYLALLSVENSSVLDLAKRTKIKRPTVYIVLETLSKKGLVSETTVGNKTHYQAEPPERLATYVENQKIYLDEQSKRLKDVIPQIKSVQREGGEKPIVKYFEGKEGIISANAELFEDKTGEGTTYLIYPKDLIDELFVQSEREKYRTVRLNKNIRSKVIYTYSKGEIASDSTGDRIKIDQAKYPLTCDISIYNDKVRISILGKSLSGVFIRSKDFAETLKSIFNVIFDKMSSK